MTKEAAPQRAAILEFIRMHMKVLAALAVFVSGCSTTVRPPVASGQQPSAILADHPPHLVIAIAVDQFSADLFDEYRPSFTGGLARLASQGIVFRNAYQPHAATETCPGHSTILTGSHPAHTGIISNSWYQPGSSRGRVAIYCAEDESKGDPANYVVSPVHLRVRTLGDLMKTAFPESQSVAVAGKDRAAVMMGGHSPDVRWFYRTRLGSGKFESDLPAAIATPAVIAVNARVAAQIATDQAPALEVPSNCQPRDRPITLEPGGRVVGTGRFAHGPDEKEYHYSPALDRDTLALAQGLVRERELGRHSSPDLLAISLSATDFVGHRFGTEGLEMCLQMHQLDSILAEFFADLDSQGIDYAVVLTADHGGTDVPERLRQAADPEARRTPDKLNSVAIGNQVARELGLSANPLLGDNDVYLVSGLDAATRRKVMDAAVVAYRASPDVAAVFTKEELSAFAIPTGDPVGWSLKERARASFDSERSGDLMVLFKHHVVPIARPDEFYATTHGSPWDNDRRVPIIFWRRGLVPATLTAPVETVDIMPTLAAIIGLSIGANPIDGHCLKDVAGERCPR